MDVRVERQQFTVSKLIEFLKTGKLRLYDDTLRDIRWAFGTRYTSRVIESMILRIPVDDGMWLWWAPDGAYRVIDGHERLRVITEFLGGGFRLDGLRWLTDLNGMAADELPRKLLRIVRGTRLHVNELYSTTPVNVVADVVSQIRMDANDVRATRWWRELVGGGA